MSTLTAVSLECEVLAALATVVDPELDEPITELGFVRSIDIDDEGVAIHIRLPTAFCSPNFAYLMASDAQDALAEVAGIGVVQVYLDDHHDSDKINAGLAAEAGYVGTFGHEAEESLDELRWTFRRKAHVAAMDRCMTDVLRNTSVTAADLHLVRIGGVPAGPHKEALLRRRAAVGLSTTPDAIVLLDDQDRPVRADDADLQLRFARAVRISVEGNSHFCRGLLATRYSDIEPEVSIPRITNTRRTP